MASQNDLVVKSNRLVEASYRLTLAEQRLVLFSVVEARRTGKGLSAEDFVEILAADYAKMFRVPLKQAYEQMKEASETLFNRYVGLLGACPRTGNPEVVKMRWVSAVKYVEKLGSVRLRFAPDMVPFITQLEAQFTRYRLEKVAHMSSPYAIRLYELLMQWGTVGRREIEVEWLRQRLQLQEQYPSIKDFKKWVIDVALRQINEHSDLEARYEQRKTGRNVTHFIFTFAPKAEAEPAAPAPEAAAPSPLAQRLKKLGIGAKLAGEWIRQDAARAQAAAAYVEEKIAKGEVQGKAAGYLREVFESGGQIGESAFEAEARARREAAAAKARRAEAERLARSRAESEALERARAAAAALEPAQRAALAVEYLRGGGAAESWDAGLCDFRNPMERIGFNLWLQSRFKAAQA